MSSEPAYSFNNSNPSALARQSNPFEKGTSARALFAQKPIGFGWLIWPIGLLLALAKIGDAGAAPPTGEGGESSFSAPPSRLQTYTLPAISGGAYPKALKALPHTQLLTRGADHSHHGKAVQFTNAANSGALSDPRQRRARPRDGISPGPARCSRRSAGPAASTPWAGAFGHVGQEATHPAPVKAVRPGGAS